MIPFLRSYHHWNLCVSIILQDLKINIDAINSSTDSDDGVCCKINHYQKNEVEFESTDEEAERLVDYMQRNTKAFVKKVPQCQNEDTMNVTQSHEETQVWIVKINTGLLCGYCYVGGTELE